MPSFPPDQSPSGEFDVTIFQTHPQPAARSYPRPPTPWEGLSDYVDEATLAVGDDTALIDLRRMAASYGFTPEPPRPRPSRIARASESPIVAEAYFASRPPTAAAPDRSITRFAVAAVALAAAIAAVAFLVALA